MTLAAGTRLGPYQIETAIGAGGMGEVYRARDTRLDRDVAVKVLPPAFSDDPDRLRRFEQEARAAAALNHPNILSVFDVGTHSGTAYVVAELLEGETLRARLDAGVLPPRHTIDYAVQIARGLAAAHEKGIVHRDLKPENVFVTTDDRVKILDFGLARVLHPDSGVTLATGLAPSPETEPGTVFGTLGYMSPEQVRGTKVDHRSDIFSFGAVLYEMLAGRRAFARATSADTMSAILRDEPQPIAETDQKLPPALERIVTRCLEKAPERRFQSASDLAFALESVSGSGGAPALVSGAHVADVAATTRRRASPFVWKLVAGVAVLTLAAASPIVWRHARETVPNAPVARFGIAAPGAIFGSRAGIALSPDGRFLAYYASQGAVASLWIRPLDSLEARELAATRDAYGTPFWSPDGRFLAFASGNQLKKIEVSGGAALTIGDIGAGMNAVEGSWNRSGDIVFGGFAHPLFRVSAAGGKPQALTTLDAARGDLEHRFPTFLPDGRRFLFSIRAQTSENGGVYVGSLDGTAPRRVLAASRAIYAAGHLFYASDQRLMAQSFDMGRLALEGEPTLLADAGGAFDATETGVLAYRPTAQVSTRMMWVDRSGRELVTIGEPGSFPTFDLAPDGVRVVVTTGVVGLGTANLWVLDTARGTTTRATLSAFQDTDPRWSPDGREIIFVSTRQPGRPPFRLRPGVGEPTQVMEWKGNFALDDWSDDGRWLLFHDTRTIDLLAVPLEPPEGRKPITVARTLSGIIDQGRFAPDSRFVAFNVNESGRHEVYVVPFPPTGDRWQVSIGGGVQPMWRGDGRELYYLALDGTLMAVDVTAGPAFNVGPPRPLFKTAVRVSPLIEQYAPTRDGRRFFMVGPVDSGAQHTLTVVMNWPALVR